MNAFCATDPEPRTRRKKPFVYKPSRDFAPPPFMPAEKLDTQRYPYQQYWRA
jgi:hypothetical protein